MDTLTDPDEKKRLANALNGTPDDSAAPSTLAQALNSSPAQEKQNLPGDLSMAIPGHPPDSTAPPTAPLPEIKPGNMTYAPDPYNPNGLLPPEKPLKIPGEDQGVPGGSGSVSSIKDLLASNLGTPSSRVSNSASPGKDLEMSPVTLQPGSQPELYKAPSSLRPPTSSVSDYKPGSSLYARDTYHPEGILPADSPATIPRRNFGIPDDSRVPNSRRELLASNLGTPARRVSSSWDSPGEGSDQSSSRYLPEPGPDTELYKAPPREPKTELSPEEEDSMAKSGAGLGGKRRSIGKGYPKDYNGPMEPDDYRIPEAPPGVDLMENAKVASNISDIYAFREMVKNGGPWDYKQLDPLKYAGLGNKYADFGNYHYGAMARAAGIPLNVALNEAGRAQQVARTSHKLYGQPSSRVPMLLGFDGTESRGDDPIDQLNIRRGYEAYQGPEQSTLKLYRNSAPKFAAEQTGKAAAAVGKAAAKAASLIPPFISTPHRLLR